MHKPDVLLQVLAELDGSVKWWPWRGHVIISSDTQRFLQTTITCATFTSFCFCLCCDSKYPQTVEIFGNSLVWSDRHSDSPQSCRLKQGFFFCDKEKQTGWRCKWSKAVRKYYKCWLARADKSVLKCASQAVANGSWRLFKPRPDNKWFNLRGESETQDMEKWRQSSQDREDGVSRAEETLLERRSGRDRPLFLVRYSYSVIR